MLRTARRLPFLACVLLGVMSGAARAETPSTPSSRTQLYRAAIALWQRIEPAPIVYDELGHALPSRTELPPLPRDSSLAAQYRRVGELVETFLQTAAREKARDGRTNQLLYIGGLAFYSSGDAKRARALLQKLLDDSSYRRFYFPLNPAHQPPPSRSPAAGIRKLLLQLRLQTLPQKPAAPLKELKAITAQANSVM